MSLFTLKRSTKERLYHYSHLSARKTTACATVQNPLFDRPQAVPLFTFLSTTGIRQSCATVPISILNRRQAVIQSTFLRSTDYRLCYSTHPSAQQATCIATVHTPRLTRVVHCLQSAALHPTEEGCATVHTPPFDRRQTVSLSTFRTRQTTDRDTVPISPLDRLKADL